MKTIFLTRHGQSQYNLKKLLGGNSELTNEGIRYSEKLHSFFIDKDVKVWTSQLKRTKQTASKFQNVENFEELNEINSGICDSMTYQEIEKKYPEEFNKRKDNKYYYRYPEGESYYDIDQRLKKIYQMINESKDDILIVAHQAILRVLISNYIKTDIENIPYLEVSLNKIYKITFNRESYDLEVITLD
jgi:broad specificity phosphatase PhoE